MNKYLWTFDGCRLHHQHSKHLNWLFLPGGPGLGSEALSGLTALLKDKIPGTIWHLDLPNDGSNLRENQNILNWRSALIQATQAFEKVILVAHSSLGMFAQTLPELEEILYGLVLISSAPNASWQQQFAEYSQNHKTPQVLEAEKAYIENPNDEHLRTLLLASAHYSFVTEHSLKKGKALMEQLPINHAAQELEAQCFDAEHYQASWIPQKVPTLILTGSHDHITPLSLFQNNNNYHRDNILIEEIAEAGHYPWFENPLQVSEAFLHFCSVLG